MSSTQRPAAATQERATLTRGLWTRRLATARGPLGKARTARLRSSRGKGERGGPGAQTPPTGQRQLGATRARGGEGGRRRTVLLRAPPVQAPQRQGRTTERRLAGPPAGSLSSAGQALRSRRRRRPQRSQPRGPHTGRRLPATRLSVPHLHLCQRQHGSGAPARAPGPGRQCVPR